MNGSMNDTMNDATSAWIYLSSDPLRFHHVRLCKLHSIAQRGGTTELPTQRYAVVIDWTRLP
jgi:hypothetical protein